MTHRFIFECYRQQDVSRFVAMLTRNEAVLDGVLHPRAGVAGGEMFLIAYEHTEELEMEMLT